MRLAPTTFAVGRARATDVVQALIDEGFTVDGPQRVIAGVLDTLDGRLRRDGLRLVVVSAAAATFELTLTGDSFPHQSVLAAAVPVRASEIPDGTVRERVAAVVGSRLILTTCSVVSRRTTARRLNHSGDLVALVSLDEQVRVAGRRNDLGSFVEVHRVAGHGKQRRRVEQLCDDLDLTPADGDGMAAALQAASESLSDQRKSSEPLHSLIAADGFRAVLAPLAVAVGAYWRSAGVSDDAELVRGLRVASRRSRSVLLNAHGVLPDDVVSRAKQGLALIGAASGPIRDLDAYLDGWVGYIEQCSPDAQAALEPVRRLIEQRRGTARSQLLDRKTGVAVEAFLRDWQRWLNKPVSSRVLSHCPAADRPLPSVVVSCIERAHATLVENGRMIVPDSPATQLHDLRKDAKRLRYLLECFGTLFAPKERKVFVRRLKSLQDNLGAHQDAEVHGAQLLAFMDLPDSTSFTDETRAAAQELAELFAAQCQAARREFASRFAEFDSAPTAVALAQLLAAI